jgi:putative flavoprotein involved in K+ transport
VSFCGRHTFERAAWKDTEVSEHIETVVVGGGQSGLAVGYHLGRRRLPFVVLDQNERVGDVWRNRWDSLRLFTPGCYNDMPGMPFPAGRWEYPSKDQAADYLEAYARELEIPVRTGVKVDRLTAAANGFRLACGDDFVTADNVVVASGAYRHPRFPAFAADLDASVLQLHSSQYRNPAQLREGGVLVVGAGNSGAEIAVEIADRHRVWLSGPDTGQEPTRAGSLPDRILTPLMWFAATRFTVRTPIGRKLRDHFTDPPRGIPLGRVRRKDFAAAGIARVGRTAGVHDGYPVLDDGRVLEVTNVIWCTGFIPDYSWIDLALPERLGIPLHDRGVVVSRPGLYFVGLLFLYSLSSALLGGVGRDAEHIAEHIASRRASTTTAAAVRI